MTLPNRTTLSTLASPMHLDVNCTRVAVEVMNRPGEAPRPNSAEILHMVDEGTG